MIIIIIIDKNNDNNNDISIQFKLKETWNE